MSTKQFKHIRVLVIDDMSEMRSSLKAMCDMLGIEKIEQAYDGEVALQLLRNATFDLILCDYDLGKGKDGQQVLEEARHAHLLHSGASFIMVTAEQSLEMVMSVLEYQPDGYISKPVTYEELQKRMRAVLKRKAVFDDINHAIDKGQLEQAIKHCDTLIEKQPKFAMSTYKIKGKILFELERFDDAKKLYESVLQERPVAWAKLGLAKCMRALHDNKGTKSLLTELIKTNDQFVECYDLLADILIEERKSSEAQKVLETAVAQSPKSALRQGRLSGIATKNDDWDTALKASRKAVSLSKNSVHSSADHYLNLARSSQPLLKTGGHRDKTRAITEIKRSLDMVKKVFGSDQKNILKMTLIEGLTLNNQGKLDGSKSKLEQAHTLFKQLKPEEAQQCVLDIAKTYEQLEQYNQAVGFLDKIEEQGMLDWESEALREKLRPLVTVPIDPEKLAQVQREEMDSLNNQGVELFEKGDLKGAVELFKKAATNPQAGISCFLNTVQSLIIFMQKEGYNKDDAAFCIELFTNIEKLDTEKSNNQKINKLKKMFKALKK